MHDTKNNAKQPNPKVPIKLKNNNNYTEINHGTLEILTMYY